MVWNKSTKNEEEEMQLYGAKQLADGMRTVRKNTILIAEDIFGKRLRLPAESRQPVGQGNAGSYRVALAF
jgi:hypothetical protein